MWGGKVQQTIKVKIKMAISLKNILRPWALTACFDTLLYGDLERVMLILSEDLKKEARWGEKKAMADATLFSSVRSSSIAQSCLTLQSHGLHHAWLPCPSPTPGVCKLMSIESGMPSNHLILCHPLLLLLSILPILRVFSNGSVLHIRWPKYWSFRFSISPSHEYSGLISFRMDQLDLLAVQGTLKSLLQHHSSKASILWHSAFFIVQLSHPYMATGKTIALTRWTFAGKVTSLLFNMLSTLAIAFLHKYISRALGNYLG